MNEMDGMVEIQLDDIIITVDNATARQLEDPLVASQYLRQVRQQLDQNSATTFSSCQSSCNQNFATLGTSFNHQSGQKQDCATPDTSSTTSSAQLKEQQCIIWKSSKNQTPIDHEATLIFLELRKSMDDKFSDKKNNKNLLWAEISKKMNDMGYYVGEGLQGRDKCRQKFGNLQVSYIRYRDKQKMTGLGKISMPPYFQEIDDILEEKDKTNPVLIVDSLLEPQLTTSKSNESVVNEKKNNRFKQVKATVVPNKSSLLEKFYTFGKENQEMRKEHFNTLMNFLNTESDKRHEEIMALIHNMPKKKSHKRKREDTNTDSN